MHLFHYKHKYIPSLLQKINPTMEDKSITLLFLNTHRTTLPLSNCPSTILQLKTYLIDNWISEYNHSSTEGTTTEVDDPPVNPEQIRLIHLGRPLQDDEAINLLNLQMSDVIHVSIRPLELGKVQSRKQKDLQKKTKIDGSKRGRKNVENEAGENSTGDVNTEGNNNKGGGCCVIV